MGGHAVAFGQLEALDREKAFNTCFADWLYETHQASGASGWAYAIENDLKKDDHDVGAIFAKLVEDFFAQWVDET